MIGSIAEPPSAIRRTAATKSGTSLIRSLSRYPAPSAVSAKSLSARPTSTYCDSTSTPTVRVPRCGSRVRPGGPRPGGSAGAGCRRSRRRASSFAPSASGRRPSRSSRRRRSRLARSTPATPSRSRTLSSAITARMGSPPGPGCRPRPGSRFGAGRRGPRRGRRCRAVRCRVRCRLRRPRRRSPR